MMASSLSNEQHRFLVRILRDLPDLRTARGRQALVENALAGFPKSPVLLGNIEWEGTANTFASDLVRHLDGFDVASSVPALPLLLSVIEPLLSATDRQTLLDLRRGHGWGVDPQLEPGAAWSDPRSPAEVGQERIIGENTLRHVNMLAKALRAAGAVVRVAVADEGYGTGFLVSADLMMTNHHVIPTAEAAQRSEAAFFRELDADDRPRAEVRVGTNPGSFFLTDKSLDFTLVRLRTPPDFGGPLTLRRAVLQRDQRVAIIQHPGGYLKKISLQNNFVAHADARLIQYYTSTEAGSSGSPVFDDDFRVVGLHHSWVALDAPDPGERHYRNQGSAMIAIVDAIAERAPQVRKELSIVG